MSQTTNSLSQQSASARAVRRALLVTGMHRSGTSALTRTLSLVGGALATELAPGLAGDNDLGFWEPVEVVALHDRALASAGSAWDDVSRFPEDWFASDVALALGDELLALLRRDFDKVPLFAIKDPRLCRLVPLWLAVLPKLGARAQFVLPLRNPTEVAASLKARNDFPMAKGYLVWLRNVLDAERATRGQERVIVTYEGLLDDWRGVVHRIGDALEIRWPRLSRTAEAEIEDFLSPELRRQRADSADGRQRRSVPGWVVRAYDALLRLASDDPGAEAELDGVREDLDRADDTYGRALAGMGFRIDEGVARLRAAESALAEASAARDAYCQEANRQLGIIAQQQEASTQLHETIGRLQGEWQETAGRFQAVIAGLEVGAEALRGEIARLTQSHADQLAHQQAAYERRIAEILTSTSWRISAPVRGAGELLNKLRSGGR